jgi:hypothetical protein
VIDHVCLEGVFVDYFGNIGVSNIREFDVVFAKYNALVGVHFGYKLHDVDVAAPVSDLGVGQHVVLAQA